MTNLKTFYFIFYFIFLSSYAHAHDSVLSWISQLGAYTHAPGQSLLLPETAPAAAFVISHALDKNIYGDEDNYSLATILNICQEAEISRFRPLIIVPDGGYPSKIRRVLYAAIDRDSILNKIPGATQRCKESLLLAPVARSFSWMQDHFSALYHPQQGIIIKILGGYEFLEEAALPEDYHQALFKPLLKRAHEYPENLAFYISPDLIEPPTKTKDYKAHTYSYGGNALGLPHGILLTGDGQDEFISACYGADEEHQVRIGLSWLHGGHVDEVISVIKVQPINHTQKQQIFLTIASPHVAFDLLKNSDEKFANADMIYFEGLSDIIGEIREYNYTYGERDVFKKHLSNKDIYAKAFHDNSSLRLLNDDIQEKLNQAKLLITKKMRSFNSEVIFIEIPVLYYSYDNFAKPIFPAPANLLLVGGRALYPKQFKKLFDDFIIKSFKDIGLNAVGIDTRNLHKVHGNLHCATKALRVGGKCPSNIHEQFCNIF